MEKSHDGYILIADITGYTLYLSQSELEHAQEILSALLEILVTNTRPPLVLSRLAGDAVISYGFQENFVNWQTFVEMIENTYVAFRKAMEHMILNNNCQCNACRNISSLDVKFFVHYGTFFVQHIGDHPELVGSDVNLVHRLLKNQVTEKTGFRGYILYSDAAVRQLGMLEYLAQMTPLSETYEHLGEVAIWVQDMQPVWERRKSASHVSLTPQQIVAQGEIILDLPPEIVWDYLGKLEFRKILLGSDQQKVFPKSSGRVDQGSIYHCYHGTKIVPQTVIEWQPFEHIVTQDLMPIPIPNTFVLTEYQLYPVSNGTRLVQRLSKARGPFFGRLMTDRVTPGMVKEGSKDLQAFKQAVESDYQHRTQTQPALDS